MAAAMISNTIRFIDNAGADAGYSMLNTGSNTNLREHRQPLWLGPRVKLPVDRFQSLLVYVCIDLRGRNISVSEQFLNDAQIGTISQQVRGEAVSQKVRINVAFKPGPPGMVFDDLPDSHGCKLGTARG